MATEYTTGAMSGSFLLGSLRHMQNDSVDFLKTCGSLGDIVSYRFVNRKLYGLHHPDLIKEVLLSDYESFVKKGIYSRLDVVFRNGLLTAEGDFWKKQRRTIQPSFTRRNLQAMVASMSDEVNRFRNELVSQAPRDETFDLFPQMLKITLRILVRTMFGDDVRPDHSEIAKHIYDLNVFLKKRNFSSVLMPTCVPTSSNRSFHRAMKALDRIVTELIEKRLKRDDPGDDLLGMLLKSKDSETGEGMSHDQVRAEAVTIFITGHETTATALSWTYYLLARNKQYSDEIRSVVENTFGEGPMDFSPENFKELGFLDNVFMEAVRMYPPIYVTYREAVRDVELGGVTIRKGDSVHVSPLVANYDLRYWSSPESFDPHRFIRGEGQDKFVFFPFGAGPRTCIGSHFSILEARIVLATLCQVLDFELADPDHVVEPEPLVTLKPSYLPVKIRLRG